MYYKTQQDINKHLKFIKGFSKISVSVLKSKQKKEKRGLEKAFCAVE